MSDDESPKQRRERLELERYEFKTADRAADRRLQAENTALPDASGTFTLTEALKRPVRPTPYLIDQLQGLKHNVGFTAQYKAGKTTMMCDCARCVVDGEPFLGAFEVAPLRGNVGFWSLEMDNDDLTDYFRQIGVKNTDRLVLNGLRDHRVPFMRNEAAWRYTVEWLGENDITHWFVDSWSRLCNGWHGIAEKDNSGYFNLCTAIDEIKGEGEVDTSILSAHLPRAEMAQGQERARGGAAFDDWVDARWVMTKKDGDRFLFAEGRKVGLEETALTFDPETGRSTLGNGSRSTQAYDRASRALLEFIRANPRCSVTDIKDGTSGKWSTCQNALRRLVRDGVVTEEKDGRSKLHTATPLPG